MTFKKYSSLENHTNGRFLEKVLESIQDGTCKNEFVAREKIHGTNFSVIITEDEIKPAKRSGPIEITENFFGWQDLMAKYKEKFERIQVELIRMDTEHKVESIQIFGEYAGGGIQKEVDYGEKDFYVFDIMFNGTYQNDKIVTKFTYDYNLKMAPLLGVGTLEELLKLPVEFESTINTYDQLFDNSGSIINYSLFNPGLGKDNTAEGLVIKPVEPAFLRTGSRIAIKYKTDAFKEKKKGQLPKIPTPLPPEDIELLAKFNEFVTWNRVSNVISHIGEVTAKDFGKVMGLTTRDVLAEAEREGILITQAQQPAKLQKELQKLITTEIRTRWAEVISA